MSRTTHATRSTRARLRRVVTSMSLLLVIVAALVAATGCGSSKPAYCSDRSKLEQDVKALPNSVTTGGSSGLQSQLATIENDATALVDSAKADFPDETSAMKSSIDAVKTAVDGLPSNPSASDLAPIVLDATAAVNAVKAFTEATKSKCD